MFQKKKSETIVRPHTVEKEDEDCVLSNVSQPREESGNQCNSADEASSLSQMVLYEQETKRGNCKKEKEREREWHTFLCLESRCIHTHDDMQTVLAFKNN